MFRLPGIFRTVALYSVPKVHFRDLVAIPDLDATYTDGSLTINADIRNLDKRQPRIIKYIILCMPINCILMKIRW